MISPHINPGGFFGCLNVDPTYRTFGEAANMLLCHHEPMIPLGVFRYPKAIGGGDCDCGKDVFVQYICIDQRLQMGCQLNPKER